MICVSCGKEISAIAKVCPYCHRDTTASSEAYGKALLFFILGAVIGYVFYGVTGALLGAFLLGVVGGVRALSAAQSKAGKQAAKVTVVELPVAQTQEPEPIRTIVPPDTISGNAPVERLAALEELKARELISADEYTRKRKEILDDL